MKKIGFCLFDAYWQRKNIGGSRIRGHWLIKYMPEAELFCQGKDYETVIYQKVYWKEHARAFNGKKILDLCDPDWLNGAEVISFCKDIDAITVSSQKLKEELEKMIDKPVYYIQDRIDFETLLPPKKHFEKAKKIAWFGYSHNLEVLDPCFNKIKKMGLTLKIISDGNLNTSECEIENVKYDPETIHTELQECDFCLLPTKNSSRFLFKSENKTELAWALGLPVAKTSKDLERFIDAEERQKEVDEKYKWVMDNCDIRSSVSELREVISKIDKKM